MNRSKEKLRHIAQETYDTYSHERWQAYWRANWPWVPGMIVTVVLPWPYLFWVENNYGSAALPSIVPALLALVFVFTVSLFALISHTVSVQSDFSRIYPELAPHVSHGGGPFC